jgi:hypothetical protein
LKTHGGVKYQTVVQKLTGYIPAGSAGINHGEWAELGFTVWFLMIGLLHDRNRG